MTPGKNTCEQFLTESWLYIDGTLSDDRVKFWNEHLNTCSNCKTLLSENKDIIASYNSLPAVDIDDQKFSEIVNHSVSKVSWFSFGKQNNRERHLSYYKIGFAGFAVCATVILILIFNSRNPHIKIENPKIVLDWKAEQISEKIEKIDSSLFILKNKNKIKTIYREYYKDEWKQNVYLLSKDIESFENKLKQSTL